MAPFTISLTLFNTGLRVCQTGQQALLYGVRVRPRKSRMRLCLDTIIGRLATRLQLLHTLFLAVTVSDSALRQMIGNQNMHAISCSQGSGTAQHIATLLWGRVFSGVEVGSRTLPLVRTHEHSAALCCGFVLPSPPPTAGSRKAHIRKYRIQSTHRHQL